MSNKKPIARILDLLAGSPLDHKCKKYLDELAKLVLRAQEDGIFLSVPTHFTNVSEDRTKENVPGFLTSINSMTVDCTLDSVVSGSGIKKKLDVRATILVALTTPDVDDNKFALQYLGDDRELRGFSGNDYVHKGKENDTKQSEAVGAEDVSARPATISLDSAGSSSKEETKTLEEPNASTPAKE